MQNCVGGLFPLRWGGAAVGVKLGCLCCPHEARRLPSEFREQQGLFRGMLQMQSAARAVGSVKSLPPTASVQKPLSVVHPGGRGGILERISVAPGLAIVQVSKRGYVQVD